MDDALEEIEASKNGIVLNVSILVLMDDALEVFPYR